MVLADPHDSSLAGWIETGRVEEGGSCAVEGIGSGDPPTILDRDVIDAAERVGDVMITDAPTLADSRVREIQIPLEWSDTEIRVLLRQLPRYAISS